MFGVDLRSLAAFRIGVGVLLLIDLLFRSLGLSAYFTDEGVLPRVARINLFDLDEKFRFVDTWSLHMASGQAWFQALLMIIAAFSAVALLIGFRTRLAVIASWVLLVSLDARNPMILNSGDILLRTMLFWSLFLPLGASCSIDAQRLEPRYAGRRRAFSAASVALLMQLGMMYFFSGIFKFHPVWTTEGSAVYYALNCDEYATTIGLQIRQFPWFLKLATWSTLALELGGPLIVFSPFWTARIRLLTVFAFWLFHFGLGLMMTLGIFPAICMVAWLIYLPTPFWDFVESRAEGSRFIAVFQRCLGWMRLRFEAAAMLPTVSGPLLQGNARRVARTAGNLLVAVLLAYTIVWNVRELDVNYWEARILPVRYNTPARMLGLDQNWAMFSPVPRTEDFWLVMRGELRDGTEVNLWDPGEPLPWKKPPVVSDTFKTQRWRKYLDNLTTDLEAAHREYFANWLHRRWNQRFAKENPERQVVKVQLIQQLEITPPPGQPIPEPERLVLWTWLYE
jgi:hypothetical protein